MLYYTMLHRPETLNFCMYIFSHMLFYAIFQFLTHSINIAFLRSDLSNSVMASLLIP
jgi:hypothetical protein